jgi:putative addiction module killer protein
VDANPKRIRIYETAAHRRPFEKWMDGLLGQKIHGIILNRIDRLEKGLFGDSHSVGQGVSELVIDFGPGYRVYFGQDGDEVILLSGGTKRGQSRDIAEAQKYWRDYNA